MKNKQKKKNGRSLFYRISAWLHLWLGLISGIILIIVCLTGCIWVFNEEITGWLEPKTVVAKQDRPVIQPSTILEIAAREYPGKQAAYAIYREGRVVEVNVGARRSGSTLKLNPYTGEVVSKVTRKEGDVDFFRWILNGHRFLWMPYKIGRPIVNYSTLVFVITLVTGVVLWWPKKWNKSTREQSFKIKWGASFKRVNYDLHNVLGFYSLLVLFAIGVTGMVWGLEWWSNGLYWATSGGRSLPAYTELKSDSTQAPHNKFTMAESMDMIWQRVTNGNPRSTGFYMSFPDTAKAASVININVYPSRGQYYNNVRYVFDRHTLEELKENSVYATRFEEADFGTKLRRMNYDIHVGSILGLPGKFMAFFASLIGATLPVTGFLIWWGRKKKKPQQTHVKKTAAKAAVE
ncbi:PepSY-associated TM helix domain-containing protein [Chitinophaga flava]|uniref:Peptidase n=1 Tax=Chitinophaga flava TaxID=2259036 RepID=A0A365XRL5_9BACT|nr:PepSY-associated TM helix domain-containing protein [Chitinophaga flava]RBL88996.1 peptidase [Chitinophaga flava]